MSKKYCLFCDELVSVEVQGDYDRYVNCHCSPDGSYNLLRDSYEPINAFSHGTKHQMFPIVSAFIREQTDCDERIALSIEDLESLMNSPKIPVTLEEKGNRFLQYLYRHSQGPDDPVVIPLTHSYNLTYSPNIQELVFIIDRLKNEQSILREGMTFRLTENGWREAAARAGGRKLKSCVLLISEEEESSVQWLEKVLPKIEQCGYMPRILNSSETVNPEPFSMELIAESKLIIADISGQGPEVYFAAGYALGLNIPVVWTVKSSAADQMFIPSNDIRPMVWEHHEELAALLQQKLIQ
ncbi:hypothetical protein [Paenibacillus wynnii]|uniref:Nucleoside 2-deoxyribosyltransferase n=1 Tax=Paenibacillus wynnii TaxID=268407 RepID=A0A098M6H2_9BACL|nr:hypothetical protein [Paenibacillus wynnii]KGE17137.1 hypothetical protein PWYN_21075 [Paenibacillus wynnii]